MAEKVNLRKLRRHLLRNCGRVIERAEIDAIVGSEDWKDQLQQLVEVEGYRIVSVTSQEFPTPSLVVLMDENPKLLFTEGIPINVRQKLSRKNELTCKMCGRTSGDSDPYQRGRKVRLIISAIVPEKPTSPRSLPILEATCTVCHEGIKYVRIDRPSARILKMQIRRANGMDQLDILGWLVSKYPAQAKKLLLD